MKNGGCRIESRRRRASSTLSGASDHVERRHQPARLPAGGHGGGRDGDAVRQRGLRRGQRRDQGGHHRLRRARHRGRQGRAASRQERAHRGPGRRLQGPPRQQPQAPGTLRQGGRPGHPAGQQGGRGGPRLRRPGRLREGDRQRGQLHHPGHAARLPPLAHRGGRQGRQEPVHREAGGRRRPRHPQGAGGLRHGQGQEALHRRGHAAPPPVGLPRSHEAHPRRRDRRLRRRGLLLAARHPVEREAPEGLGRPRGPDAQLVQLRLAVRRPHRRAARPQHRRDELGRPGPSQGGHRHRLPHPHRPRLRAHLRFLLGRSGLPQRGARRQHVQADQRLLQQHLRGDQRHQGQRPAPGTAAATRSTASASSIRARTTAPTSRNTPT